MIDRCFITICQSNQISNWHWLDALFILVVLLLRSIEPSGCRRLEQVGVLLQIPQTREQ